LGSLRCGLFLTLDAGTTKLMRRLPLQTLNGLFLLACVLGEQTAFGQKVERSQPQAQFTYLDNVTQNKEHRSVEGRRMSLILVPVNKVEKSQGELPRVLIQGGLHGNERLTPQFVQWLAERVAKGESPINRLNTTAFHIDFLPNANPDGLHKNQRYNAQDVNLNRNFSVLWGKTRENPGLAAFSEPETRAIRDLILQRNYALAIDVHGYINWLVAPSTPEEFGEKVGAAQKKAYAHLIGFLQKQVASLDSYKLKTAGGLGDGGSFEDWAFWQAGVPAFCLEMKSPYRFIANGHTVKDKFLAYENIIANAIAHSLPARSDVGLLSPIQEFINRFLPAARVSH